MTTADDELRKACVAQLEGQTAPNVLDAVVHSYERQTLDLLGRIGPVTAWVLALREHRKRVENDTGSPLPDQSQWAWKENNHAG